MREALEKKAKVEREVFQLERSLAIRKRYKGVIEIICDIEVFLFPALPVVEVWRMTLLLKMATVHSFGQRMGLPISLKLVKS